MEPHESVRFPAQLIWFLSSYIAYSALSNAITWGSLEVPQNVLANRGSPCNVAIAAGVVSVDEYVFGYQC